LKTIGHSLKNAGRSQNSSPALVTSMQCTCSGFIKHQLKQQ